MPNQETIFNKRSGKGVFAAESWKGGVQSKMKGLLLQEKYCKVYANAWPIVHGT